MGYKWDTDGIQNHLENHPRNHNWLVTITSMYIPSGKHTKNYGTITNDPPFSMGKSIISTGPFSIANC